MRINGRASHKPMQWQKTHIQGFFYLALCGTLFWGCQRNPGGPEPDKTNQPVQQKPVVNVSGTLQKNTIWDAKNRYIVTGNLMVPRGITLEIPAGTEVRFDGFYQIAIYGGFKVMGGEDTPVSFASNKENPQADDWNRILLTKSANLSNIHIENFLIENAMYGLLVQTDSVKIRKGVIRNCFAYGIDITQFAYVEIDSMVVDHVDIGIRFAKGSSGKVQSSLIQNTTKYGIEVPVAQVRIFDNTFMGNQIGVVLSGAGTDLHIPLFRNSFIENYIGISYNRGRINIKGNLFDRNQFAGIKISLGGILAVEIRNNNFNKNLYHLYFPTAAELILSAPDNWWGTVNPDSIAKRIFDRQDRSYYRGTVNFIPFLTEPVDTAGAMTQWPEPKQ